MPAQDAPPSTCRTVATLKAAGPRFPESSGLPVGNDPGCAPLALLTRSGHFRSTERHWARNLGGMSIDVPLQCACGAVTGVSRGVTPANACRLSCRCDDCQVYAHYLRRADTILDVHGGTELFYSTQARISIATGREQLRTVRLSPTGMLRVFTGCCRTPVVHVPSPRIAFVGIPHLFMQQGPSSPSKDEALGTRIHKLQGRFGRGPLADDVHPGTPFALALWGMSRMLWHTLRGLHVPSAFHDASGAPVVAPEVLSAAEVERLRAYLPTPALPARAALTAGCS
jgi:hypothetical protein